uniref:t-SNARE coiled-coil homology domain-containing protein n=1 Tax=Caenorhabditis tropicalis TaxID=1561998 RepID=A0A1I7UAI6_9PELO
MNNYRYSKLNEEEIPLEDAPSSAGQILSRQEQIIQEQDEELELVGNSVRTLRGMSSMIGDELDQQSIMLDDLGQEMEYAETRLDTAMKKMAKLTHLEDESSQCKMIMVLSALLFFLIFVLIL